jgi:MSHA biogenesis protein MshJ
MNSLAQFWRQRASREQWLMYLIGLALIGLLYAQWVAAPLAARTAIQEKRLTQVEQGITAAQGALRQLDERLAADPNPRYRQAIGAAEARREAMFAQIDGGTARLISPTDMQKLLEDLLRRQSGLRLVELRNLSAPLSLPEAQQAPSVLYRHGLQLTLEGGYFDLLAYLEAVQASGWQLHWSSLDYRVGEAGPGKARVRLELYTLSRHAGWLGV